jgi:uncharacterized protein YdhG (YjbR/CyaY superfamily)
MTTPSSVDAYIAGLPVDRRAGIEDMRRTIQAAAPDAIETIAYSMPAFRTRTGKFLVSFAAYKRHTSLFPASGDVIGVLGAELTPYLAAKATIQFPVGAPIPLDLVRRVAEIRVSELRAGTAPTASG